MNFIEKYDCALTKEQCNQVMQLYEICPNKVLGMAGGVVDIEKKKGMGVDLHFRLPDDQTISEANHQINKIIADSLFKHLESYKKKYYLMDTLTKWKLDEYYHIQKFQEGGGYFVKHCEQEGKTSKRMLVWMFYLNNAKCGTRFYYQNTTMKAKQGRLVIWPAAWTHMHSGVTPNKGDKYIVTGWFSYD